MSILKDYDKADITERIQRVEEWRGKVAKANDMIREAIKDALPCVTDIKVGDVLESSDSRHKARVIVTRIWLSDFGYSHFSKDKQAIRVTAEGTKIKKDGTPYARVERIYGLDSYKKIGVYKENKLILDQ
jgi:hypothetical protein